MFPQSHIHTIVNRLRSRVNQSGKEPFIQYACICPPPFYYEA
jgi:hypothetical protein